MDSYRPPNVFTETPPEFISIPGGTTFNQNDNALPGEGSSYAAEGYGTDVNIDDIVPKLVNNASVDFSSTPAGRNLSSSVHGGKADSMSPASLDLLGSIKGMYRILDLISEQGSGGLVDKVIIAQDSLRELINSLSPGSYVSLTKVDFKALDKLTVKPIGVYGCKAEITNLLFSIGAIDSATARSLSLSRDDSPGPILRSGLYLVRSFSSGITDEQLFAVYWPEDTTWDDDAVASVRRNRVTFMRYLTKIADQVVSLISSEHAKSLVWSEDVEDVSMDVDYDESDRLFTFEVAKTNEQEENVTIRTGFTMFSPSITDIESPAAYPFDPTHLMPKLVVGETAQAFLTVEYMPPTTVENHTQGLCLNGPQLRRLLAADSLQLSRTLGEAAISALVEHGLQDRFPKPCNDWKSRKIAIRKNVETTTQEEQERMKQQFRTESARLEKTLRRALINRLLNFFSTLDREKLGYTLPGDEEGQSDAVDNFLHLIALYPKIGEEFDTQTRGAKLEIISTRAFQRQKTHLITLAVFLDESTDLEGPDRQELINLILDDKYHPGAQIILRNSVIDSPPKSIISSIKNLLTPTHSSERNLIDRAQQACSRTTDVEFISGLGDIAAREPLLQPLVATAIELAHAHLEKTTTKLLKKLIPHAEHIRGQDCKTQIQRAASSRTDEDQKTSRLHLIQEIEKEAQPTPFHTIFVDSLDVEASSYETRQQSYKLTGREQRRNDPALQYKIHTMSMTADHRQSLQLNPAFVPALHVEERLSHTFCLPLDHRIMHIQLLENGKCLLIVDDPRGNLSIFLESPSSLNGAIKRGRNRKMLHRDKIGKDFLLAFDEAKRMLSVCAASKLQLHIFLFDETFSSLQAWGSAVNLIPWYNPGLSICLSCFVCGSEEILLIDSGGYARIFSLITQQFRPASLQLQQTPTAAYSSPDGACLLLAYPCNQSVSLRAYHWSTFGSTEGIDLDLPALSNDVLVLTSMVNRGSIHLMGLDLDAHQCHSIILDITKKATEFLFKEKGSHDSSDGGTNTTIHNCLLDCHADVWTRFPVIPAVRRQAIVSSGERLPKRLVFVTDRDHENFRPYFSAMIQSFEQRTRKPTGEELRSTRVVATETSSFLSDIAVGKNWDISRFRLGEWLVDLLCLIPIHIAITRENRFIPLKDGVSSAELEKSLLGAEVSRIVDSLSLGWYESIFQSYMASKPVKVVSSMGEQSVGKSFALNHLVDTSFAGSAMRTTEGVWMSVAPTDDALIVALDFEGVHSIERSTQEDTLLVLFNTAISNLVLFRNNFALSRDITGLFQSFQSSSTVLDPAANPSLFQSTLAIIIKDVVDSDKKEIVREFSLKFQKIVQVEQDANFISRLHAGKLDIIPWPVIESKQFYTLFAALKKRLDQQPVTHAAAGEFLHTLKTLMAKIKANDWGSLSQTLVAHRAQRLLSMLPNALAFGFSEVEPANEALKNFDTDILIDGPDTSLVFFLSGPGTQAPAREAALSTIRKTWDQHDLRHETTDSDWIAGLTRYLDHVVGLRIGHVREWISSNLLRFKSGHANIEILRRTLENAIVDLNSNVELCKMQCASCHLLCLRSRRHEPDEPHDCQTSHQCVHNCDFDDEHPEGQRSCGYPAGHSGKHICVVDIHLCGEPCDLNDKKGCFGACTKVVGHAQGEHMCSARVHSCGEPCDLQISGSRPYSCAGTCIIPSHEDHLLHICDNRMCPVSCQLCRRLCSETDHLHGLEAGAIHLCGQVHSCSALCSAEGICEIDTAPHSIDATFTGRHETFQYTKYSQVAKRLPCIISILPGATDHLGPHNHSTDQQPFHFCETRCESCGYFCTLPRGHSQQEHETSHGSMSKTRWAVDGPDGTILELNNGRKFASDDDGAPMMCNLVCQELDRHVHLDYCRADVGARCDDAEVQHLATRLTPNPDRPKDWISHRLHWRRTGFKDPYARDDQVNFAKCDAMCPGPEHAGTATNPPQPSYCTLPIFHALHSSNQAVGMGYLSNDGHLFPCKNPAVMQQAFHVMFVIDRSGSMASSDRRPLGNAPGTDLITRHSNNRLGAVYSSLHGFWISRQAALTAAGQQATTARRDAYSVILFDHVISTCFANDFRSSPEELLNAVVRNPARGGTNFTLALTSAQTMMRQHWSTERTPVVIFLSDGECTVADQTVQDLCRSAVALGKPLSFHAVSFGPRSSTLRRMAQIALEIQNNAPSDPLMPTTATVPSSYAEALDTVRLAETFLGIAESLRKPRGSLLR